MRKPISARIVGLVFVLSHFLFPVSAWPCTTVMMTIDGHVIMAKSFDFLTGVGMVVTTMRGHTKSGLVMDEAETPLTWTSRYGSITFTQMGKEMPYGGMNEMGLMVEQMWFEASVPEPHDDRPAINELQWIQWALDMHANVAELVADTPSVRIVPGHATIHYMACDPTGACATFETIDGSMVISTGADLPIPTLTNDSYPNLLAGSTQYEGFGGTEPVPDGPESISRFLRASRTARQDLPADLPTAAFSVLDSVWVEGSTQWNIVYVPDSRVIYFRTADSRNIKWVSFDHFPYDCTQPAQMLDINQPVGDEVSALFIDYTFLANQTLIGQAFGVIPGVSPAEVTRASSGLSLYVLGMTCTLSEE